MKVENLPYEDCIIKVKHLTPFFVRCVLLVCQMTELRRKLEMLDVVHIVRHTVQVDFSEPARQIA